jgi:hypothetical protein
MATAANLAGIGRRALPGTIADRAARVVTIVVLAVVAKVEVVKEEDQKGAMKAGPVEAGVRSRDSRLRSSWRS